MQRDTFDFESSKAFNETLSDSNDEFQLFKSLSLPELLSLLVQRQPPFFYGDEIWNENESEQRYTTKKHNETTAERIANITTFEQEGEYDNTTENLQQKKKLGLYDSIPCHKLGNGSDNMIFEEEQSFKLLEMLRWSIQPPHPVVIDEPSTKKKPGMKCRRFSMN